MDDDVGPGGEDGLAHGGGVERVEHDGLRAQRPDVVRAAAGGPDDVVAALHELRCQTAAQGAGGAGEEDA